jgi:hypothetical protein
MPHRIPRPSPALVVALLALFVALSGTAVAAGIVPHARLADNARKLLGKTPAQVAALAPAPTSLSGYVTLKSAPFSLSADQGNDFNATCDAGQKVIAGGYDNPSGSALAFDSRPSPDGAGWRIYLHSFMSGASGTVYAVCLR